MIGNNIILVSVISYAKSEWNDVALQALAKFAYEASQHKIAVYSLTSTYINPIKRWSLYFFALEAASKLVGNDGLIGVINPAVVASEEGIRKLAEIQGDLCGILSPNLQDRANHFELCCKYSHVWNKGLKFWFDWHLVLWRNKFTEFLLPLFKLYFDRLQNRTYLPLEDAMNVAFHHYFYFMDKSPNPNFTVIDFAAYDEQLEHPISFVPIEKLVQVLDGKEWVVTEVSL